MLPQTEFLHPKGAWYLERYTDDVMEPFPEEVPSTEGNVGLWTQPVIFSCTALVCLSHYLSFPLMN